VPVLTSDLAMALETASARSVPLTSAIVAPVDPLAYRASTLDAPAADARIPRPVMMERIYFPLLLGAIRAAGK